jgi:hypothetical protein
LLLLSLSLLLLITRAKVAEQATFAIFTTFVFEDEGARLTLTLVVDL